MKIVDFGLSNTHEGNRLLSTACGSPCYAAPEMIAGKKYMGPLADIWSMGVILFALVCGYLPFEDPNTAALYKKILAGDYKAPKFISPEVRDLIARILETDPRRRYTMQDIRQHVWYTMVPESDIPKEHVDVYNDERTRADTVAILGQAGIDSQALLDGLASHACNSLTAMYYLYEQKQRNIRAKSTNQQQSRPEINPTNSSIELATSTAESGSSSRQPSIPNQPQPTPTPMGPPPTLPLHGVYRPVPLSDTQSTVSQQPTIAANATAGGAYPSVSAPLQPVAPSIGPTNISRPVRPAPPTTLVSQAANSSTVSNSSNVAVVGAPLVTLNMAPYLAAPPLIQHQRQHGSPTNAAHKTMQNNTINNAAASSSNQSHHTHNPNQLPNNLPNLELYMKQAAQLPSIQQQQSQHNQNPHHQPQSHSHQPQSHPSAHSNPIRPLLAVPPLQFSQQHQLHAQQKPIAGSQSARAPATHATVSNVPVLGSLTARPQVSTAATAEGSGASQPNPAIRPSAPSVGSNVPAQQQQLLAVSGAAAAAEEILSVQIIPTALAGPDTESSGGRPNTRRSRVRSRGVPGMGHLDEEATNGIGAMGPAIGSLDAPDVVLSSHFQQLQIQPMETAWDTELMPLPQVSPNGGAGGAIAAVVRTGGQAPDAAASQQTHRSPTTQSQPKQPLHQQPPSSQQLQQQLQQPPAQKIVPEQPSAARTSSAQGGRRGRNLIQISTTTAANSQPANSPLASPGSVHARSQSSAREEAARNKSTQQQASFLFS